MSLFLEGSGDDIEMPMFLEVQSSFNQVSNLTVPGVYSYPQTGTALWHWDHTSIGLHTSHSAIKYQNESMYIFK